MLKTTEELEIENQKHLEKLKDERTKFIQNLNDCLNNKKGEQVLEYLYNLFNIKTNLLNPNENYYRDGKLYTINFIKDCINKINKKSN